jgi:hypothetical protein
MFCPGCGMAENQANQFCRACGTDLRSVRDALERPDKITASAITAREEIGRVVAAKIRSMQSAEDLAFVVEDVLPEIEKFLESPEEKRLRGIRKGVMVSTIGVGAMIAFFIVSFLMGDKGILVVAGAGLVTFFVGLGIILNTLIFSAPKKLLPDSAPEAESQRELDANTHELLVPGSNQAYSSITEHTTEHLNQK